MSRPEPFAVFTEQGSNRVDLIESFELCVGDKVSIPQAGIRHAYVTQVHTMANHPHFQIAGDTATMTGCYALYKHRGAKLCKYNALSSYLLCAVNPGGPCENCSHFEASTSLHKPRTQEHFHRELARFNRRGKEYVHPDYPDYKLSEGIYFLISQGFRWIVEDILSEAKNQNPAINDMLILRWDHPTISIFDDEPSLVLRKTIEHAPNPFQFPLKLWFVEHTLLLPKEY